MFYKDRCCDYSNHSSIDLTFPSLINSFREYVKWDDKMEFLFEDQFYSEQEKVKLVATIFIEDTNNWWNKLKIRKRIYSKRPIETWEKVKPLMRK